MNLVSTSKRIAELVALRGFDTDKVSVHSYGDFYDRELDPYRGRPIRLLEIGVYHGGSLRLWDAYFEGHADITGADIDLSRMDPMAGWVADLYRGDAYDPAAAEALGDFDIIIDDGPHTLASMLGLIRLYVPSLYPGGILVIEDVQHEDWFGELFAAVPEGHVAEAIDLRHVKGRYDDLLFVIRKPA